MTWTHHAPLNAHLHRIKKEHPAKCVYCPDSDETIEHFLFHCPLYDQIQTTASSTKYTQHAIWIHYTTATNSHLQHVSHEQTWRDCPKSGGPRKVKKGKKFPQWDIYLSDATIPIFWLTILTFWHICWEIIMSTIINITHTIQYTWSLRINILHKPVILILIQTQSTPNYSNTCEVLLHTFN